MIAAFACSLIRRCSSKRHFCWFQWHFLDFRFFIVIDEYDASFVGPFDWSSVIPQALLLLLYVINELIAFSACFNATPVAGRIANPVVNFTFTKFQPAWIPTDAHFQHTCAWRPQTGNIITPYRFRLWCWKWINGRLQSWHRWTYKMIKNAIYKNCISIVSLYALTWFRCQYFYIKIANVRGVNGFRTHGNNVPTNWRCSRQIYPRCHCEIFSSSIFFGLPYCIWIFL